MPSGLDKFHYSQTLIVHSDDYVASLLEVEFIDAKMPKRLG